MSAKAPKCQAQVRRRRDLGSDWAADVDGLGARTGGAGNPQPLWAPLLSSHVCYTGQHLPGYQSGWALDPRRAVHRCRCPAHRFRQDGRRPLSDPPATPPSPATGIDIDIRRAGIARAVAENTTTIADQPTEEPVVSRTVRRACMTVRLFDKPRSRRC